VDPNCAWSVPDAIRMIHALEPYGIDWVEQPTTLLSVTAMRQVREVVRVPIAADQAVLTEYDVYDFVRQRACDAICLSTHEAGGLLAFGRAAAIAGAAGVPVCLHGQSVSGITDAAQHHLGLSTPNLTEGNQIMHQLLVEDVVTAPDLTPKDGRIGLIETPGLGVKLDRDAVARAAERYRKGGF
jgi:muconate cycloisomerase